MKKPYLIFARLILLWLMMLCAVGDVYAHSFPLNEAAIDSCNEKKRSQACQYQNHHNDVYIGTCQYVSDDELTCVRNRPIQKVDLGTIQPNETIDDKLEQKQ